jgi:hypothetical protein
MESHAECTRHVVIDDNEQAQSDSGKNIVVYPPGQWEAAVAACCSE